MHRTSWADRPAAHSIPYRDTAELRSVLARLREYPPLVFPGEIDELRRSLAKAARGEMFVLHGGDCVERFADCRPGRIADRLKILLQMSVVLTWGARTPVLRVGRMAGQYFKPRSTATEMLDGAEVLTYRGDPVHEFRPSRASTGRGRDPDPERLVEGYFHAASTLNYIRAMIAGGFADLHHPGAWRLASMGGAREWGEYRDVVDRILDAIHFMESFGGVNEERLGNVSFYTSHEALHLPWEDAFTRTEPGSALQYNVSAHTVWLGARTSQLDGAHVAYLRGIANPIGIKVPPERTPEELISLLDALDPHREEGRITLITRLGRDRVEDALPPFIRTVRKAGHPVVWSVDPMHGNTVATATGRKTRRFDAILSELRSTFAVHRAEGSRVGGVHFELTGDEVTECTGGAVQLDDDDLHRNYESWCDPRLNYTQSMETAFLLAGLLQEERRDAPAS